MNESVSDRRMAENEVVFRHYNESMQDSLNELIQVAKEDGQEHLMLDPAAQLHFYCECSDENCRQRILLTSESYSDIHEKRSHFVVVNGHEVGHIEKIIRKTQEYTVVEKRIEPPASVVSLHATSVNNVE